MKKIKNKVLILTLALALAVILLTGCTKDVENQELSVTLETDEIRVGLYTGEVENDIPNGNGKFSTENPEGEEWYYEGEFVNGEFEGTGEMVFESGLKYSGQFHENSIIEGSYYNDDGKLVYKGEFADRNNYFLYEGEGILYDSEEVEMYKGEFYNDKPSDLEKIEELVKETNYEDLASDESRLEDIVKVTGTVFSIWEYDDYVVYLVATDNLYEEVYCIEYTQNDDEKRIVENDVATFCGEYEGLYTYETGTGDNTVPYLVAWSISIN
ncbi:MAG: hypothetical protein JJE03_02960 [Peptostreptococcaceae bacterium]|nr:hypothetical protein [Peptostreptococcaceae bacterium]